MTKFNGEQPDRGIIQIDNSSAACTICAEQTHFADVDFQAWVCSTECQDKLMSNFKEALAK
ncbi:hypothetical protein LCGC14_0316470 [marine sediment metagenome]|uniref:Uncharacterized protein n=1 Tax=marine sediment metagenome TaxID=412755 RepID=A0A0F9TKH4_9ZZZZ